jgi:hypothetical protein
VRSPEWFRNFRVTPPPSEPKCKLSFMAREVLASKLSEFIERYRHATQALELFVHYSLKGIVQNKSETSKVSPHLSRLAKALQGDMVLEAGPDTVPVERGDLELLVRLTSDQMRYYDSHPKMLLEMSLIYACALFDALISDVITVILQCIPERLRSGRSLTAEEALGFNNRTELIEELARREVRELMYKSIEKQFEYFHTSFGVKIFDNESLEVSITDLAAIRERRNLVAHNNGVASPDYVAKFPGNISIGDNVVVDVESTRIDRITLSRIAITLVSELLRKLVP